MREPLIIEFAKPADVREILSLIKELAEYEKMSDEVIADETLLENALFGGRPVAECLLAREGQFTVGFALFFHNFSTFLGRPGLYLEDLFVRPVFRGKGYGKALLVKLAEIAKTRECGRMEWSVLKWNKPAIDFYKSIGAIAMDGWDVYRLDQEKIGLLLSK